jgi:molybdopterin-guanine dinucleotide biosynthesis protein B
MPLNGKREFPICSTSNQTAPPLICIVGYSGSGKTTLVVNLITCLKRQGYQVGTIKHDIHGLQMDHPGKDSYRHKAAGASTTIISSPNQIAMVADVDHDHSPEDLLPMLSHLDIILIEGFKRALLPKIEVYRPETGKGAACKGDPHLLAVVCDTPVDWGVRRFASSQFEALADYIVAHFQLRTGKVVRFPKTT